MASARSRLERAEAKYARWVMKEKALAEKVSQERVSQERVSQERVSQSKVSEETLQQPSAAEPPSTCVDEHCACLACRCRAQASEVAKLSAECEHIRSQRHATPRKIPLSEASDRDAVKLNYERKLFTDTIKLNAYQIETRLYELLGETFRNRETEGRGLIQAIFAASGDLRVSSDVIEVHLNQLSAPRYTEAMQSLCEKLNAMMPTLPESSQGLRFFVKPRPAGE